MALLEKKASQKIGKLIESAKSKLRTNNENDLCKYIPGDQEGHLHHFSMQKLKKENPEQLCDLIEKHIIEAPKPQVLNPKPRKKRSNSKGNSKLSLGNTEIKVLMDLVSKTENTELLKKLRSKLSLTEIKRELLDSIKNEKTDLKLYHVYMESVNEKNRDLT